MKYLITACAHFISPSLPFTLNDHTVLKQFAITMLKRFIVLTCLPVVLIVFIALIVLLLISWLCSLRIFTISFADWCLLLLDKFKIY